MPFEFTRLAIPEVIKVSPRLFQDERGFFTETYKFSDFAQNGIPENFLQDNHSRSSKGVLRGLHFQHNPKAQGKLVRCVVGEILDVAVDIRQGSPTFGQWVSAVLSQDNHDMLYVPVGFAHGFLTLSDWAEVVYKTTSEYAPEADAGIRWDDPALAIEWGISTPSVSPKDEKLPLLKDTTLTFTYSDELTSKSKELTGVAG
jgi:dTDP-4-dehydrorhamnose 3,5-epimerase